MRRQCKERLSLAICSYLQFTPAYTERQRIRRATETETEAETETVTVREAEWSGLGPIGAELKTYLHDRPLSYELTELPDRGH